MYLDSNPDPDRMCYSHLTCATGPVINPHFKVLCTLHSRLYKCTLHSRLYKCTLHSRLYKCTVYTLLTVQVYSVHIIDRKSVQRWVLKPNSRVSMTHPLSFFYPSFLFGGREKRERWVVDTSEFCLRNHLSVSPRG